MSSSNFYNISNLLYFIAMAAYISYVGFKTRGIALAASGITIAGFISHTLSMAVRWADSHVFWVSAVPTSGTVEALLRSAPLRNLFESLNFFVWALIAFHLIIEFKYKNRSLGAFVLPVAALALAFIDVSGMSKEIEPLVPALQSNWLLFHVFLSFIGYAAFGVSFGAAVAYLITVTESRNEKPYIFGSIVIGIFLVVLIAMGIDFLTLTASQRGELLQSYFLKATFKNSSGLIAVASYIISLAFVAAVWRFGLGLKKVLEGLALNKNTLDEITYKSIAVGFPLFTIGGVIMGAIWANSAWGTYWSWDPKETWSLITWFVYAVYLHARLVAGWKGKKAAILSIIGFVAVIFTYLGVNLVLSGLHSYGSS
ncbi:MAG: c-type cytochrome biogenesis protein CcsB [Nitrospirae bacterium]|nr:c-type cytochrome biogenesis protein CcsB [Nitrospirota bacterium]